MIKENIELILKNYYEEMLNEIKNNTDKYPSYINNIEKPEYFVGKTPKILLITDRLINYNHKNTDSIILNGEVLKKVEKTFKDSNQKEYKYTRFFDKLGNEYKPKFEKDKKCLLQNNNGIWKEIDEKQNTIEINTMNTVVKYLKEIIEKTNKKLNIEDFVIFSYCPNIEKIEHEKIFKKPFFKQNFKKIIADMTVEKNTLLSTGRTSSRIIKDIINVDNISPEYNQFETEYYKPFELQKSTVIFTDNILLNSLNNEEPNNKFMELINYFSVNKEENKNNCDKTIELY